MSYKKRIGIMDRFTGQGYKMFVGYCPECNAKHYLHVEEARELASTFWFSRYNKPNLFMRLLYLIPRINISFEKR